MPMGGSTDVCNEIMSSSVSQNAIKNEENSFFSKKSAALLILPLPTYMSHLKQPALVFRCAAQSFIFLLKLISHEEETVAHSKTSTRKSLVLEA
jgi:hypothetical protein